MTLTGMEHREVKLPMQISITQEFLVLVGGLLPASETSAEPLSAPFISIGVDAHSHGASSIHAYSKGPIGGQCRDTIPAIF